MNASKIQLAVSISNRTAFVFSLAALILVCGCHKKEEAKLEAKITTPEPVQANSPISSTPHTGPQPPPITANDSSPQDIHEMEHALVGWVIRNHHRPQSFEEFATASQIKVPPPPPGKKYVIAKNMHIILVDK